MKKLTILGTLLLTAVTFCNPAFAKKAAAPSAEDEAKMQAWMKASTPGPEQKMLEAFVGTWNHTTKMWMDPKVKKPEITQGVTEIDSIMDGRFIRQRATGVAMGKPFEGLGITGYDNVKKSYSTFWIDNMSTAMMTGTGEFDAAKNAIVDSGSFSCPMSASGKAAYRSVWTFPKKDAYKYEMFSVAEDGKETRMMEIFYKRAK